VTSSFVERERKFDVDESFRLPELTAAVPPGSVFVRSVQQLTSDYFDTADHALRRVGATLRRRSGSDDTGWHLKLPHGVDREEVHADLSDDLPEELARLLLGATRGSPLEVVASLRTERHVTRVIDAAGDHVADLDLDHVRAAVPAGEQSRSDGWTEVEIELGSPSISDEQLDVLTALVVDAGARPSASRSKLQRALGAVDVRSDDAPRPSTKSGKGKTKSSKAKQQRQKAGAVLLPYLREQQVALLLGDIALRRGDASVIHRTRVATRRLRSALRVFSPFFDGDRGRRLDVELRWYAELLGAVRDGQVLEQRLDEAVAALAPELVVGPVQRRIDAHLEAKHDRDWARLQAELVGSRYLDLVGEIAAWTEAPPFTADAYRSDRVAVRLARKADEKVARRLRIANKRGDLELLHRARKSAKRARYAAEAVRPIVGGRAKQEAKQYEVLQDLLGEHQDSVVAAQLLLELGTTAAAVPDEDGFTFGVLYQLELERAAAARRRARKIARRYR
jgi:CHAD domain-containing protein